MNKKTKLCKLSKMFLFLFSLFFVFNFKIVYGEMVQNENKDWNIISKTEPQAPNKQWVITFKADVDEKTVNTNNIYVLDSDGKKFDNIDLRVVDSKTVRVIPKKEYTQGKTYFVCVDKGLKSKKGTTIKPYKMQFTVEKIDSDFFKIRNIDVISDNMINVYFTQPVGKDAELAVYYEILKDGQPFMKGSYISMEVKQLSTSKNGVSILLKSNILQENGNYTIRILGDLCSDYGSRLLNGKGDEKNFKGISRRDNNIKLESVQILSNYSLQLTFNKPLDQSTAEKQINYLVSDSKGQTKNITYASVNAETNIVRLRLNNPLKENENYSIDVFGVKDSLKRETFNTSKFNFTYNASGNNDFSVVASPIDRNTLMVYFNKILRKESVMSLGNYSVSSNSDNSYYRTIPSRVFYDPDVDPYCVKLRFSNDFKSSENYKLTLSKNIINDLFYSYNSDFICQFGGLSNAPEDLKILSAKVIGNNQIKLSFNNEIMREGTNLSTINYMLECNQGDNRKIILSCGNVKYVDSKTLVLTFDSMNFDESYILKLTTLVDYWGKLINYENGFNVIMGQ